jgi:hypothetical protein
MKRLVIGAAAAIVLAVAGVRIYYVLYIRCCAPPVVCCAPNPITAEKANH